MLAECLMLLAANIHLQHIFTGVDKCGAEKAKLPVATIRQLKHEKKTFLENRLPS